MRQAGSDRHKVSAALPWWGLLPLEFYNNAAHKIDDLAIPAGVERNFPK